MRDPRAAIRVPREPAMRGAAAQASKNDPFEGGEFRCSAAKAFNYISFHDEAASKRAGPARPMRQLA
ncbi:hypothetical protein GCM10011400_55360 [Paraburkholderia caffeinilytica]|uniref:Uncharacterized protein n=1 Tax=Paraburkholderia caffeinilytica TaxID=1761016 RepID=A0ABQ1N8N9_9BURK|nr:hypothetical protein GCM10011400_55360 [Paraburkholderia caffeinilytica]